MKQIAGEKKLTMIPKARIFALLPRFDNHAGNLTYYPLELLMGHPLMVWQIIRNINMGAIWLFFFSCGLYGVAGNILVVLLHSSDSLGEANHENLHLSNSVGQS